jgi:hypothetical protein
MRKCWLLLGVFGAMGIAGCASWQHPVPVAPDVRDTAITPAPLNFATQAPLPSFPANEVQNSPQVVLVEKAFTENRVEDPKDDQTDDPLTQFSESLKSGDQIAAARYLELYVRRHPDQTMFRLQLAELQIQTKSDNKARAQFEQFVSSAQTGPEAVRKYLVHAHTRLMEIAKRTNDPFSEQFHRGVGLLILVQEQDNSPDRDDGFCEEMLCKSLRALNEAREQKPSDQRVRVYLAEVYDRMGNRRAGKNERGAVRNGVVPGELTPGEQALVSIRGL